MRVQHPPTALLLQPREQGALEAVGKGEQAEARSRVAGERAVEEAEEAGGSSEAVAEEELEGEGHGRGGWDEGDSRGWTVGLDAGRRAERERRRWGSGVDEALKSVLDPQPRLVLGVVGLTLACVAREVLLAVTAEGEGQMCEEEVADDVVVEAAAGAEELAVEGGVGGGRRDGWEGGEGW